jgi:membrane-associated phospholipid phosphatase
LVRVTEHASGTSFPSGHVFSAVLLYGMLAVLVEMVPLPSAVRRVVQALCLLVTLLMGPARVYVGAHWPSDVLGGYLWGTLLLLLVLGVRADADRIPHRHPHGSS